MISFIVIGHNEGWKLYNSFAGINTLVEYNSLKYYEIIYVDSNSSDNSIEIAKIHKADKIVSVSGNINAAVARNVGAKTASGNILFFIDGDIELKPFTLKIILNSEMELKYEYVVGFLDDVNYTSNWKFINQAPRHYNKELKDKKVTTVGGGIFIIKKENWNRFGGMDERLRRTQDRDLSLRMAKKGIKGIRKAEIFGLHHTIPYKDKKRMWDMIFSGAFQFKGVMIRKHLFNSSFYHVLIREESSLIIMLLSFILLWISPYSLFLYLIAVIIRNLKHVNKGNAFFMLILQRILQDLLVFVSILFFYPSKPDFIATKYN